MPKPLLTEEDIKTILQKRFSNSKIKYVTSEIKPLSEIGGFMGDHFILNLTYDLNGEKSMEKFFLKTIPKDSKKWAGAVSERNVFEKEIFFYDYLLNEFEKYGCETSYAPKCFFFKDNETLVLEDLPSKNLKLAEKKKLFDLAQCKSVLKALALFHGSGYIYEEEMSKKLGKKYRLGQEFPEIFKENFFTLHIENSFGANILNQCLESFLIMINHLPESEEYKQEFINRLKKVDLITIFTEDSPLRKTCGHGDLWFNNIFFSYENNIAKRCCLIDFQILRYFHPGFDIIMLLLLNTNAEFRDKHMKDLLQFYYYNLSEILREKGYLIDEILPLKEFHEGLDKVELAVQIQVAAIVSFVFLSGEKIEEIVKDEEEFRTSDMLFRMSTYAFINDQDYKENMTTILYSLHETLFKD